MDYKVKENSFIARIAAWKLNVERVAIVMGKTIHLHNASKEELLSNNRWIKHEMKHVEQFRRYGFFLFLTRYLVESVKKGYINNKYEIEAREAETLP